MTHEQRMAALDAYRVRGDKSLKDYALEQQLFEHLLRLEELIDAIGPTSLRHKMSEQLVDMRASIWAFEEQP